MAGNQYGFNYSSELDIKNLLAVISNKLEQYMSIYNLSEDAIAYIQITFRQKDKKLLSEFSLLSSDNLIHIPRSDLKSVENNLSIPVSIDEDSLGKALPVYISEGIITHIHLEIDGKLVNFLDIIKSNAKMLRAKHKDNIISFDSSFKFYLLKDNYDYVLAVKILGIDSVDKIRYSMNGVILSHVTDTVVNDIILRNTGEKQIVIRGNNVISSTQNIKLKALIRPISKPLFVENSNIGVIDIETYKAKDGSIKVYALGFKTNLAP